MTIIIATLLIAGCREGNSGSSLEVPSSSVGAGIVPVTLAKSGTDNLVIPSPATATEINSGSGNTVTAGIRTYHNPEPSSIVLLGLGLAGLVAAKLRRNKIT